MSTYVARFLCTLVVSGTFDGHLEVKAGLAIGVAGRERIHLRASASSSINRLQSSGNAKLLLTFYTRKIIFFLQNVYMRKNMAGKKTDLLQGTLDLLVLKALALGPLHGLGVSHPIAQMAKGAFQVKPGSLFPVLHPMEAAGGLKSPWGELENKRRAKYYCLTKAGQRQLEAETEDWQRISLAIADALQAT